MEQIIQDVRSAVRELYDCEVEEIELTRPKPQFGDLATTLAMGLAKRLGKSPRELAQGLVDHLLTLQLPWLASAEVAGPGYINIRMTSAHLIEQLERPHSLPYENQKIVIETNNPNPFKDIHIGHAMNAIVSDTIANLLEAGGAEVVRVSYHGDVGLHVAKSLWAIRSEFKHDLVTAMMAVPESERPVKLREWYATGARAYKDDPAATQEIEALIQQTFAFTDAELQAAYALGKEWSFRYFDHVFSQVGNAPVIKRYLESEADAEGRKLVEAHIGDVFERSDDAIIFPGEKYDLHTRVFISSRGTSLYEARDLGLLILKDRDFVPDMTYVVTAEEQREYFRVIIAAVGLAAPDIKNKIRHISHGTVKLTTGKMSSRTGDVVNISWLFDRLHEAVRERAANEAVVEASVLAALRYSLLKNRITSDTVFDIKQAIALEGNTGPYLQYAHARACSILSKSEVSEAPLGEQEFTNEERSLINRLAEYSNAVSRAVEELMPHYISSYLFELSKEFNGFYEHNRVVGDEREAVRIGLVRIYARTLKAGLTLLGIPAPDRL